jgi:hypothetical protein
MPAFANSARAALTYVKETTYGTTPASPAMKKLRYTGGDGPQHSKNALISEERRSDRQRPIGRHGMNRVGGSIESEGLCLAHQDLIAAALGQDIATLRGFSSISAATNTLTWATADDSVTRAAGSWITDGFRVGMKVRKNGGGLNNGVFTVTAVTATKLNFVENVSDETVITGTHLFEAFMAANGAVESSFSIEREYADIVQFEVYTGVEINSWEIRAEIDAFVQWTFGLIGSGFSTGTTPLSATPADVDTDKPLDTYSGDVLEGGAAIDLIRSLSINATNNRRPAEVIGQNKIVDTTPGRFTVSGSLRAYFQNAALRNKFTNETESSLSVTFKNPVGDELYIELPKVLFMGANKSHGGDDDVMLDMPWEAFYDATTGLTMRVNMIPAVAA